MVLAHAATTPGPHPEYLVLAGALFVLGVVLYIQKSVQPAVSVVLVVAAVALGSGAFWVGGAPAAQGRAIVMTSPKPGERVEAGKPIPIEFTLEGGTLASGPRDKDGGHLHVFLDGVLVAMPVNEPTITFTPGPHTLGIEFVDANHKPFDPRVRDEIELEAR